MNKLRLPRPTYRPVGKKRINRRSPLTDQTPRPRNAFILFRCDFVDQGIIPKSLEKDHRRISEIIGHIWGGLSEEQKAPWVNMANEEKEKYWIAQDPVLQANGGETSNEAAFSHQSRDIQPSNDVVQSHTVQYAAKTRNTKLPGSKPTMHNIIMTPADYTRSKSKHINSRIRAETEHQTYGITTLCEPANIVNAPGGVTELMDSLDAPDMSAASTRYYAGLTRDSTDENTHHQRPTSSSRAQWEQLRPYLPRSWTDEEWEVLLEYLMDHETELIQAICNGQDLIAAIGDEQPTCDVATARATQQGTADSSGSLPQTLSFPQDVHDFNSAGFNFTPQTDTSSDIGDCVMEELEDHDQTYLQLWESEACQWSDLLTGTEISGSELYLSAMEALSILLGTSNEYDSETRGVIPSQTLIHPPAVETISREAVVQHPVTTWTIQELQHVADGLTMAGLMSLDGLSTTEGSDSNCCDHTQTTALNSSSPEDYCTWASSSAQMAQAQPINASFPEALNEHGHMETSYTPEVYPAWNSPSAMSFDFFDFELFDSAHMYQAPIDAPNPFETQLPEISVTPKDVTSVVSNLIDHHDVQHTHNDFSDFSPATVTLDQKIHSRLIAFKSEIIQLIQEEYADLSNN